MHGSPRTIADKHSRRPRPHSTASPHKSARDRIIIAFSIGAGAYVAIDRSKPRNARVGRSFGSSARKAGNSRRTDVSFRRRNSTLHATLAGYRFTLADGNWFYLAGIWRPAYGDWPNPVLFCRCGQSEVARYQNREGAVLLRRQRTAWFDGPVAEDELLRPPPPRTFRVEEILDTGATQQTFASEAVTASGQRLARRSRVR